MIPIPTLSFVLICPMARVARTVVAGLPHHVTQRGNRREAIFLEDGDHEIYLDLLAEQTRKAEVEVWAEIRGHDTSVSEIDLRNCTKSRRIVRKNLVGWAGEQALSSL
jgi:hypothetical protein